jgi:hypothetical protein
MTTPGTNRCSDCRKPRAAVRLDDRVLCDGCADRRLASMTGWPELVPAPPAEIIADTDGRRHLIGYRIMRMPGGITAMAEEIGEEIDKGYRIEFTIDHDGDQAALPDRLRAAVHSAIGHLYLQPDDWYGWGLTEDEVAGRLVEDVPGDRPPRVVVDGHPLSWEDLGRLLKPFAGWSFHLRLGGEPAIHPDHCAAAASPAGSSDLDRARHPGWFVLDSSHYPSPAQWRRRRSDGESGSAGR